MEAALRDDDGSAAEKGIVNLRIRDDQWNSGRKLPKFIIYYQGNPVDETIFFPTLIDTTFVATYVLEVPYAWVADGQFSIQFQIRHIDVSSVSPREDQATAAAAVAAPAPMPGLTPVNALFLKS